MVGGSGSVTALGHYGDHPRPRVADRGTPSRIVKRVAPDKEGAADKQCLRRRTTLISNPGRHSSLALSGSMSRRRKTPISNRGGWSSLNLFRYIHLGECHSKVKHGTWAAAGFVPEMAEEPHYGQRYPRILMEASTDNQETGSILRCGRNRKLPHYLLREQQMADDGKLSPTLIEEGRLVSE